MDIKRVPSDYPGISSAVVSSGLVYAVATDPVCSEGIAEQTRNTLEKLESLLVEAGSSKAKLVQATVYLSDISNKPVMDEVWRPWIGGQENWPQRACVGVDLDPGYLVEIVVTAALD